MSTPMLAKEVVDEYLSWLTHEVELCEDPHEKKSRASTLSYYEIQLGKLRTVLPVDLPVDNLKAYHLDKSPDRKKRHFVQAAKRVFHWAWKSERIPICPLRNLEIPRCRGRKRVLSADEFERILRASAPFFAEFLWCLFRTGARPIELRELRWKDVRFEDRVLRIENYKGKRMRDDDMPARDIPIDKEIVELLRRRLGDQQRLPSMGNADSHVFTGRRGQPFRKDAITLNFRRACVRAKIVQDGERAVPYTLRHTAATTLTVLGMGQKLLADVLGHSKISTTERYQHASSADKVDAVDQAHQVGKARDNPMMKVNLPKVKDRQPSLFD